MNNKRIKNILSYILVISFVLASFSGCKANTGDTLKEDAIDDSYNKKDSLIYGIIAEPTTLDPAKAAENLTFLVQYQIFDTLVREEQNGSLVPGLADKWEVSDDGKEIIFYLKENVKFHNGEVMTAEDVVFSINRSVESAYTSSITNAIKSAEAIDDLIVKLKLKQAFSPILNCMATANLLIVNKKAVEEDEEGFGRNPVGTGPYVFKEWKNGEKIVLESFKDYYRGEAAIKNLTFRILTDSSTAVVALEKGEIDILDTPPKTDRKNLIENEELSYYETTQANYFNLALNNKDGVFSNKKVREAISYAIDREAIVIGAVEGVGTPVECAMVLSIIEYPEFKSNSYNPEKAKELLAEAGYPNGFKLKLKTIESPTYTKPTEVVQEQLRVIGIDAEMEIMERGAYLSDVIKNRNYEATVWSVASPVSDPDFVTYPVFHSSMIDNGGNFTKCNIPELDKLLEEGRVTQSREEREKIYLKVCEIIKEESVLIPLYTGTRCMAAKKELKGLEANPVLRYYVYNWSW